MLVIVVIMFGVCWLPLHTFFLMMDFNPQLTKANKQLVTVIYYAVFWLAMSNSCANPVIYGFTNDSFRVSIRYGMTALLQMIIEFVSNYHGYCCFLRPVCKSCAIAVVPWYLFSTSQKVVDIFLML